MAWILHYEVQSVNDDWTIYHTTDGIRSIFNDHDSYESKAEAISVIKAALEKDGLTVGRVTEAFVVGGGGQGTSSATYKVDVEVTKQAEPKPTPPPQQKGVKHAAKRFWKSLTTWWALQMSGSSIEAVLVMSFWFVFCAAIIIAFFWAIGFGIGLFFGAISGGFCWPVPWC